MCGTLAFSIERRWLGGSFPLGLDITLPPSRMSSSVSLYSLREQTILHIDLSTFHLFLLYLCKQTHPSHRVKSSVFLSILAVRHLLPLGEGSEFCFLHKNYFTLNAGSFRHSAMLRATFLPEEGFSVAETTATDEVFSVSN